MWSLCTAISMRTMLPTAKSANCSSPCENRKPYVVAYTLICEDCAQCGFTPETLTKGTDNCSLEHQEWRLTDGISFNHLKSHSLDNIYKHSCLSDIWQALVWNYLAKKLSGHLGSVEGSLHLPPPEFSNEVIYSCLVIRHCYYHSKLSIKNSPQHLRRFPTSNPTETRAINNFCNSGHSDESETRNPGFPPEFVTQGEGKLKRG